jgi:hypothetical protein
MAKYYGEIGYRLTSEVKPGVWQPSIIKRNYYGDVIRNTRKLHTSEYTNDNLTVSNEISIVADPFANENFHAMVYAEYMGVKWKINNVDVEYPRLKLSLGEVYVDNDAE